MEVKKTVEEVLAKPMDRKEFLAHAGAAALAVVGVTALMKSLGGKSYPERTKGYGSSSYGGKTQDR